MAGDVKHSCLSMGQVLVLLLLLPCVSSQNASCPLKFLLDDVDEVIIHCNGPGAPLCCSWLVLTVTRAQAAYARVTDELWLPDAEAESCSELLQSSLVNLTGIGRSALASCNYSSTHVFEAITSHSAADYCEEGAPYDTRTASGFLTGLMGVYNRNGKHFRDLRMHCLGPSTVQPQRDVFNPYFCDKAAGQCEAAVTTAIGEVLYFRTRKYVAERVHVCDRRFRVAVLAQQANRTRADELARCMLMPFENPGAQRSNHTCPLDFSMMDEQGIHNFCDGYMASLQSGTVINGKLIASCYELLYATLNIQVLAFYANQTGSISVPAEVSPTCWHDFKAALMRNGILSNFLLDKPTPDFPNVVSSSAPGIGGSDFFSSIGSAVACGGATTVGALMTALDNFTDLNRACTTCGDGACRGANNKAVQLLTSKYAAAYDPIYVPPGGCQGAIQISRVSLAGANTPAAVHISDCLVLPEMAVARVVPRAGMSSIGGSKSLQTGAIAGIVIGCAALVGILVVLLLMYLPGRPEQVLEEPLEKSWAASFEPRVPTSLRRSLDAIVNLWSFRSAGSRRGPRYRLLRRIPFAAKPATRTFTYEELAAATNAFAPDNLLGTGSYSSVYKGTLPDGTTVAIKYLQSSPSSGESIVSLRESEFRAEAETIERVHHKHLLHLLGYCCTEHHRCLVLEYMPNGSLAEQLHGKDQASLTWPVRLGIAQGTAKGLAYLHDDCEPPLVHCDIKPGNILLDKKMEAKVADFGFSKPSAELETSGGGMRGTPGYLPRECVYGGVKNSTVSDVYSFGVVLLELVTGRRAIFEASDKREYLVDWVREAGAADPLAVLDPQLSSGSSGNEIQRALAVALACTQRNPQARPTMAQVVRMLAGYEQPPMAGKVDEGSSNSSQSSWQEKLDYGSL